MEAKHTPGPLTVKIDEKWPFRIKTYNGSGEVVFSVDMPCYSTSDKRARDAIECRSFKGAEREQYEAINRRAIADEVLRATAPDMQKEMLRYLPVLERLEADDELWGRLTEGLGIATLNGYRAAIAKAKAQPQEGGEA